MERWEARRKVFSTLLGGVASISLLVGGIGIMNIMLVTVTERIREIGTRMAIGARPSDIMLQFLIEALTMSLSGGLLGIGLGIGLAKVVDKKWSTAIVSMDSIVLAFGVSCAIGVFFGFWPAFKASRLDPITDRNLRIGISFRTASLPRAPRSSWLIRNEKRQQASPWWATTHSHRSNKARGAPTDCPCASR